MVMLEFSVPSLNLKILLPLILITITALTVLLIDVFSPKEEKSQLGHISIIGVCFAK